MRTLIALACVMVMVGCEGQGDPASGSKPTTHTIIGGTVDTGDLAVVHTKGQKGSFGYGCTGTVIGRRLVLTAAHCTENYDSKTQIRVMFGHDTSKPKPSDLIDVTEWHADPKFMVTNNIAAGHDVAVLVLAKDAPVKPIPINRAPLSKAMIGDAVRVIGFGFTSGYTYTGSGVKRQITTTITDVYQGVLSFGKAGKTSCQGDSGGPVLMKVNGVESVAGVLSYGYPNCAGSGSAARVDLCTSFLDPFLKLHGGECVSDCTGKSCGDDGCGGSCGICPVGQTCSGGQCVCAPDCNGRVCGDDGCGGSCGTCGPGQTCLVDGQCHGTCVPDCAGKECGGDGCGGSCGSCGVGESCSSGQCVALPQNPCDTNGGWETEPNNSAGAANVPCQTGMIYGVLDYSGDTDWFTFEVPPQNAFKVNLASMGYSMKLHHLVGGGLKLLQSAQSQISGTASGSGGAYFVEVYSAAGSFDLYTGYSVTITSGP